MLKAILRWFSKESKSDSDPFPPFDTQQIALDLNIASEAERLGRANVPDKNADEKIGTEQSIISEFTSRYADCHKKTTSQIAALKQEMLKVNFDEYTQKINYSPQKVQAEFKDIYLKGQGMVQQLQIEVDNRQQDYESFRLEHRLTRFPTYPDGKFLSVTFLVLAIIIETALNGFFFAKGSELGLLGGVLEAFMISLVNVVFACIVAFYVARYINHRNKLKKITAILFSIIYFLLLVVFIVAITHYRDAFTTNPDNAWSIAAEKIKNLEFNFLDFDSLLFMAISAIIAFASFIKGYGLDDKYPEYGKHHRRLQNSIENLSAEKEETCNALNAYKQSAELNMQTIKEDIADQKASLNEAEKTIESRIDSYLKYMASLEQGCIALVKEFQQTNQIFRTEPSPKYFNQPVSVPYDDFKLSKQEIPDVSDDLEKLEYFNSDLEDQSVKLTELCTEYLSNFTDDYGSQKV